MKLLAFETATEACSIAVYVDGEVRERFEVAPRRHAELALPWAEQLLAEAGIARAQLDAIALSRGPGAFTGVRLAIALAQGIALALDRPLLPVSTLAVLAARVPPPCVVAGEAGCAVVAAPPSAPTLAPAALGELPVREWTTLVQSLDPGGVLLYETFASGHETVGRPARPDFLLQPGELLQHCQGLRVVGFEDGFCEAPARYVQRICAVREAMPPADPPARYRLPSDGQMPPQ